MSHAVWDRLLDEARAAHLSHPDLRRFCPFPDDLVWQDVAAHHIPPSDLLQNDPGLTTDVYPAFRDAFAAAAPLARWRETYKGTSIGAGFLNRFGCYELVGRDAPYASNRMRSFVVYAPAGLHYPWHHHPAEELYLVLAGGAEFLIEGQGGRMLGPGDTAFHASGQPHAMTTHDSPVMAYVLWRGELDIAPVLSYPARA